MSNLESEEIEKPETTDLTVKEEDWLDEKKIMDGIMKAQDKQELQKQFDLFNLSLSKKNAARVVKVDGISDKALEEIERRISKRPSNISTKELLEMVQVLSSHAERSKKMVDQLDEKDMIRPTTGPVLPTTGYTINIGTNIDKDGKNNVVNAIKEILEITKNSSSNNTTILPDLNGSDPIIEVDNDDDE